MAIFLKDTETDKLARQVARLTGETLTEAIRTALRDRLRAEELRRGRRTIDLEAARAIAAHCAALPLLDLRSPDDILGYNDDGLPT